MTDNQLGKYFGKLNKNGFFNVFFYLDHFTVTQCAYINKLFYKLLTAKMPKRILMVKTAMTIYKKYIHIIYQSDLKFYLCNNAIKISKDIKSKIKQTISEDNFTYYKFHILEYFFKNSNFPIFNYIDLSGSNIGIKSLKYLIYILSSKNSFNDVYELNISDNNLNSNILEPLTINFNNKTSFNHIIMNKAFIDTSAFKNISKIKVNQLTMNYCNIDSTLISHLYNEYITHLNLAYNNICSTGVLKICQNIPNLQLLNLSYNSLTDIAIFNICHIRESGGFSYPSNYKSSYFSNCIKGFLQSRFL